MALDFADVLKVLGTIKDILKFWEDNKELLEPVIKPILRPILPRPPAPPVEPVPPDMHGEPSEPPPWQPPEHPVSSKQIYYKLTTKLFFLEKSREEVDKERAEGNPEPDRVVRKDVFFRVTSPQGPDAQMLDQRMHFDITPFEKDLRTEYRKGDPRHPVDDDGFPALRYRWWVDGKLNTDSTDEEDRFELQSVKDDAGCTPVLQLGTIEPGRHRAEFEAYIPATYNGGVEVVSNRVTWYID